MTILSYKTIFGPTLSAILENLLMPFFRNVPKTAILAKNGHFSHVRPNLGKMRIFLKNHSLLSMYHSLLSMFHSLLSMYFILCYPCFILCYPCISFSVIHVSFSVIHVYRVDVLCSYTYIRELWVAICDCDWLDLLAILRRVSPRALLPPFNLYVNYTPPYLCRTT